MSGTSVDGLDAALVEVSGTGLMMKARVLHTASRTLGTLGPILRKMVDQHLMSAGEMARAMTEFSLLHIAAIREACGGKNPDLICVHGQTVFHAPPHSWQMLQPSPIARVFGCPVVYDLRAADIAAGGQGAPITPLADLVLFGDEKRRRGVVNLGGFCNVTLLPRSEGSLESQRDGIVARDVCACNHVLDLIARERFGVPFDEQGSAAAGANQIDGEALDGLRALVQGQAKSGRSLGTGDELFAWLQKCSGVPGNVLARTACMAIAETILEVCGEVEVLILAGGGTRNEALVGFVREGARDREQVVLLSSDVGIDVSARESACFAVLGALCQDGVPITLPQVTGVKVAPVSGSWVGRERQ
ncbi:MAG: anhydro-N-acetylmuramic acid kinase [Planctomycetes bacterium]|nr:anhydro-N-acetylmuramic acid kinase [Planctomycetota bacterium]